MLTDLLSDFTPTRAMAADAVDRATCWALTSPGCGWCVGAFGGERGALSRDCSPPPHLHTSDSRLTPDVGVSHTHLRTDMQILLFQLGDACALWGVRACVRVLPPNKAGCLLLAGFGGRFASMPSLSPEEGGMRRGRCSAVQRGDVAFRRRPAHAQKWQLLLVQHVALVPKKTVARTS